MSNDVTVKSEKSGKNQLITYRLDGKEPRIVRIMAYTEPHGITLDILEGADENSLRQASQRTVSSISSELFSKNVGLGLSRKPDREAAIAQIHAALADIPVETIGFPRNAGTVRIPDASQPENPGVAVDTVMAAPEKRVIDVDLLAGIMKRHGVEHGLIDDVMSEVRDRSVPASPTNHTTAISPVAARTPWGELG